MLQSKIFIQLSCTYFFFYLFIYFIFIFVSPISAICTRDFWHVKKVHYHYYYYLQTTRKGFNRSFQQTSMRQECVMTLMNYICEKAWVKITLVASLNDLYCCHCTVTHLCLHFAGLRHWQNRRAPKFERTKQFFSWGKIFTCFCEFYWSLEYGILVAKTTQFLPTPPSLCTLFPNQHGNG